MAIIRNSAFCENCKQEVESTHRHDFVTCSCGALAVDGGKAYLRRAWTEGVPYTETSVVEPDDEE